MSRDFVISIRPDAPNPVRIVVDWDAQAQNFDRQQPGIADADLDKLRLGAAPSATRVMIENAVTDWFLGSDLRPALVPALGEPVRIVISTDHKIESRFANLPFELTRWDAVDYLVLKQNLTGLVYAPVTSPAPNAPAAQTAPFRVLLIRAEPNNLQGTIPSGFELRDKLRNVKAAIPGLAVDVRLLSREAGADGPATWPGIQDEIKARPPAAVLYLGHGDLIPGGGGPPSPVLLIERADGEQDEVSAASLRQLFRTQPVPLVALAGCLTAAAAPATTNVRFGQSMAQFLVSGEGGVTVAIGMRYRIDVAAATRFLEEIFRALFGTEKGNVDLAIKAARVALFMAHPHDLGWAAPMVYRRVTQEPLFPELRGTAAPAAGPAAATTPDDDAAREQLSVIWTNLARLPADPQPSLLDTFEQLLDAIDAALRKRLADRGVVGLMPAIDMLLAAPGTTCKLALVLTAAVDIDELGFDLVLRGSAKWRIAPLPDPLKALGVKQFVSEEPGVFSVVLRSGKRMTLPAGTICTAEITLGGEAPSVVEVSVAAVRCAPAAAVMGWVGAVVVRSNG